MTDGKSPEKLQYTPPAPIVPEHLTQGCILGTIATGTYEFLAPFACWRYIASFSVESSFDSTLNYLASSASWRQIPGFSADSSHLSGGQQPRGEGS
jgi:hypothetical protein